MEDNSPIIFKSYLRRLLQDLNDIQDAIKNKDYDDAGKKLDKLIVDTQRDIEEY